MNVGTPWKKQPIRNYRVRTIKRGRVKIRKMIRNKIENSKKRKSEKRQKRQKRKEKFNISYQGVRIKGSTIK